MSAVVEDKDALRSSFERFAAAHAASDPAWLRDRRTAAFARYVEKGLPGPRDEPVRPRLREALAQPQQRVDGRAQDALPVCASIQP